MTDMEAICRAEALQAEAIRDGQRWAVFGGIVSGALWGLSAFLFAGFVLFGCAGPRPAAAQDVALGEKVRVQGITESGNLFEVFVSEAGGFTLVMTDPTGRSCLVGSGEALEILSVVVPGEPS